MRLWRRLGCTRGPARAGRCAREGQAGDLAAPHGSDAREADGIGHELRCVRPALAPGKDRRCIWRDPGGHCGQLPLLPRAPSAGGVRGLPGRGDRPGALLALEGNADRQRPRCARRPRPGASCATSASAVADRSGRRRSAVCCRYSRRFSTRPSRTNCSRATPREASGCAYGCQSPAGRSLRWTSSRRCCKQPAHRTSPRARPRLTRG
jgi:hypothetical protein